jgi:FAD/FMN-containing dehydrogenase
LSIWTHNLKGFEYLPSFTNGEYHGKAARVAAGVETFELAGYTMQANLTIVGPGGSTVGPIGGWFQGGGHGIYTSYYGLGADQILSIQVVTADGRFITADANNNTDLFWALRGGGGCESQVFSVILDALMTF